MGYKFSTPTRLAIIAIPYLVESYYDDINVTCPEISEVYNMNSRALMVALRRLVQVGILTSQTGGSNPGFKLARTPDEISMYDITSAIEGIYNIGECKNIIGGVNCALLDCRDCVIYTVVNNGLINIDKKLKTVSLLNHYNITKA